MKYALITDQHWGLKGDSEQFYDNFELFYDKIFFPEIKKRGIKHIIHLGDVFHSRKKIDTQTLSKAKEIFFDKCEKLDISVDIIIGNHDIYFKEINTPNSSELTLKNYSNVTVHSDLHELDNILFVPWINKNNARRVETILKVTKCNVVMAHLELKGFNFNKTQVAQYGMSPKVFSKFDMVLSGHYHTKSSKGNIHYLGSPTQHTWIDVNDDKGFHIFDSETLELNFIKNPHNMYEFVDYKEDIDVDKLKNKYLKLFVPEDVAQSEVDKLISKLNDVCYDLTVIYKEDNYNLSEEDVADIEVQDTSEIIKNYVVEMDDIDHTTVYDIVVELYKESLND